MNGWGSRRKDGRFIVPARYEPLVDGICAFIAFATILYLALHVVAAMR